MREDWVVAQLGKLATKITKGSTPTTYGYKFQNEGVNFIKIENVKNGFIMQDSIVNFISEEAHNSQERSKLQEGDILFSIAGTIGETCLVKSNILPANTNQAFAIINGFNDILLPQFLIRQLESFAAVKIKLKARGGAMNNVSLGDLKELSVIVPPLPIQRAIVQKIESYFGLLDKGIAELKTAQEQLKIYRQAVLKKAFEGEYPLVTIDTISFSQGGYAFKSSDFKETGEYQIIKIGNVRPGLLRLNESPAFVDKPENNVLEKYLLRKDDVVITLTGTRKKRDYGYTAIVNKPNLLLNQRVAYLRFSEKCIPKYFLYYSWTEPFKEQFFGSETGNVGQGNVGMKSIQKTIIPLPSINEQKQVIKEIESRLSVCDKVEENISEALEKAEALRQSILKKAFEGKLLSEEEIAQCKQEADYEPASVLLERIKKEKN